MVQQTMQHSKLAVLAALYEKFSAEGDVSSAEKMKQLMMKVHHEEFIIAFCGHFSAGKSSMINFLLQQQVLPSSPIPTSANTVKVQKGEDFAEVVYRDGKIVRFPAPYDIKAVKDYAKDGAAVSSITISSNSFPLPEYFAVMDTPGIDSTDDAHRVSTESALHLADAVFYVMDYNHVQSEVNFLFTKELAEAKKPVYLIINMIDKHDEHELRFADFKKSTKDAFAAWNVFPEKIFYTSIRDLEHPHNELQPLKEFLSELTENRQNSSEHSVFTAATRLCEQHVLWLGDRFEDMHADELAVLYELADEERNQMEKQVTQLEAKKQQIQSALSHVKTEYETGLETILKNAYIMPAETRELAAEFLESNKPDFKTGLFFAKKKTEAERAQRLKTFLGNLQEKVKTQLEWHVKELAVKTLASANVHDAKLEQETQRLSISLTKEFLTKPLKSQVQITGEYVLNYTNDLAENIKKEARNMTNRFFEQIWVEMNKKTTEKTNSIETELATFKEFHQALLLQQTLNTELAETKSNLLTILSKEQMEAKTDPLPLLYTWEEQEKNAVLHYSDEEQNHPFPEKIKAETGKMVDDNKNDKQSTRLQEVKRGKDKLQQTAASLKEAANLIQPIKGFQSHVHELQEKAVRLKNQTFTVALFGAFSAGKSSFANALMGESVLPVSPNPTTAAINKIMAADSEHLHGTASVKLKTEKMLLEDVNLALAVFGMNASTLDEAHMLSGTLTESDNITDSGKTQLSFLRAFFQGLQAYQSQLGQTVTVDLEGFRNFASREEQSCLVDLIELYYDCDLTKQGIVLVDTPGADSINARHTGAAFEYIKNADAILFVTYYNHPFSRADREFLIQLGRVKDSFAMDKMFFIVNAVDLAQSTEERDEVLDYVETQLAGFGIRFPKLFALTSKGALLEKQKQLFSHPFLPDSGLKAFQAEFDGFMEQDLTALALESAKAALARTYELLLDVITASKQDAGSKKRARQKLHTDYKQIQSIIEHVQADTEKQRLKKEIDELTFYSKQRVFFRLPDFFKESFNPAVLKEDGRDLKVALQQALANFLQALGFDFAQEMRATALRTELFANKLLQEKQQMLIQQIQQIRQHLTLQPYDQQSFETINFNPAFQEGSHQHFKKELAFFKNPKAFFEKNEKANMQEALQLKLDPEALHYVKQQGEKLYHVYSDFLDQQLARMLQHNHNELKDTFAGLQAALEETVDISRLEQVEKALKQLKDR